MIVIGETPSGGKPTLEYCVEYANQYGVPLGKTYIDHGNQWGGWETTFTYLNPYTAADGSFSLPWEALLDGDDMTYVFSSGNPTYPSVSAAINELLAD